VSGDRSPDPRLLSLAALGVRTAALLHELRQPLFAVQGRLQLARAGQALDAAELEALLGQLAHVRELLDHHSGLGRPDDSWLDVDLGEAAQAAAGMAAERARAADVTVSFERPRPSPVVRGRAVAVRQIALNLLTNAIDAAAGSPARRVTVAVIAAPAGPRLVVEDSGPGVPPGLREQLFEPFYTTKEPGHGSGLGLFVARGLVDELGGEIHVEAAEGGGARMVVTFPP
jgi:signal transduction histidine kinase